MSISLLRQGISGLLAAGCFFAGTAGYGAGNEAISLITFSSNTVPEEFYKPAPVGKLPLPVEEILKMKQGGVDDEVILDAVEKRHVIGAADADGLVALKKAGLGKDVIKAVSRYALPENRSLDFEITLQFVKPGRQADPRYLYVVFNDAGFDRILYADLDAVLQGKWRHDDLVDSTDLMLKKQVRVIRFFGAISMKKHGKITAEVILSRKPNVQQAAEFDEAERSSAKIMTLDYPAYSLDNDCQLKLVFLSDVVLAHKLKLSQGSLQCEFN